MFKVLDNEYVQGKFTLFRDLGKLPRKLTHSYAVTYRKNSKLLGYIKWSIAFYGYAFYCLDAIIDRRSMHEIAEYCDLMTKKHFEKRPLMHQKRYYQYKKADQRKLGLDFDVTPVE